MKKDVWSISQKKSNLNSKRRDEGRSTQHTGGRHREEGGGAVIFIVAAVATAAAVGVDARVGAQALHFQRSGGAEQVAFGRVNGFRAVSASRVLAVLVDGLSTVAVGKEVVVWRAAQWVANRISRNPVVCILDEYLSKQFKKKKKGEMIRGGGGDIALA